MTWMCTIAKNQFLDFARKNSKAKIIDITEVQNYISEGVKDMVSESVENKLILSTALTVLDDQERAIFMLHLVNGLKHREIAELVGLPHAVYDLTAPTVL